MKLIKLWTIRTAKAWKSDQRFIWNGLDVGTHYWTAYHWMAKQMRERLKIPVRRMITFPVWANIKKPDLRVERHHWNGKFVLIEFEMPENEVLLSDYDDWHLVLNHGYNGPMKEYNKFEAELKRNGLQFIAFEQLPWKYRIRIEKSWERIFEIKKKSEVQATMWEIPLKNVKKVVAFNGKPLRK